MEQEMRVTKRDGELEEVSFDKILKRVKKLGAETAILAINYSQLVMKVIDQLYDKIHTTVIDELTAEQCASLSTKHLDYATLANRIVVSNNHKNTVASFSGAMETLYNFKDVHGLHKPLIDTALWTIIQDNAAHLDGLIDYSRDYLFDYFGFKTLERAYLMRVNNKLVERPQHMWLRVAIGIHGSDFNSVKETYDLMSTKYFTHATPTLFNAGTPRPQLSSCYLISMESDSIDGIYNTLKDCAKISKWAGGIGLHIHNIRATGSHINGTNGTSNGIVPMLRNFNSTARYVDQCFAPGTLVYTLNGAKPIETIRIGEQVLSSDGLYHKVNLPVRHMYKGKLLEILVNNSPKPIRVTPEHQIMTVRQLRNHTPDFTDANELEVGNFLVFPLPKYENDIPQYSLEDCRMYGILLGAACYSIQHKDLLTLYITTIHHLETHEFIVDYFKTRNIIINVFSNDNVSGYTYQIYYANPMFKFTLSQLFDSNKEKQFAQEFLHLPTAKIKQIISGLVETRSDIYNTNTSIVEAIRYMNLRLKQLDNTVLHNKKNHYLFDLTQIESIVETDYDGIVYDFEIASPHDYVVAHMGIAHNGGGKRNGSFAIYLEPWHADIEDFLELKKNHGDEEMRARDLFYALWIPDLFMEKVKTDQEWGLFCPHKCPGLSDYYGKDFNDLYAHYMSQGKATKIVKARDLWFKILDSQMETGTPYLLYKDAANQKSNQKNLGTIKSSNLCVAPETRLLTDKGYFEIQSLNGKMVNVWNGEEFSETTVFKTGTDQPLITIETSDGCTLDCTPEHKFYIANTAVEAQHLKVNDQLIAWSLPLIDGQEIYQNSIHIIPINATLKTKIDWLSYYYDYDIYNTIIVNEILYLSSNNSQFIYTIKLMLQTCGINSKIVSTSVRGSLMIFTSGLQRLIELGFKTARINLYNVTNKNTDKPIVYISKITNSGRRADTYCFNEPKRHAGVFNGMITSQCTEIIEYSDANETAVCNLASIGLGMFVGIDANTKSYKTFDYDKLHHVTKVVTRNLNKVIDINFYPTEKTRLGNLLHRPIGIGVQGLADAFALMDIAFHSEEARCVNKHIFETIYHAALECSNEIAIERQQALNVVWTPGAQLFTDTTNPICNTYNPVNKEFQSVLQTHKPILAELKNLDRFKVGAYSSFTGSPASRGELQFDMWGVDPGNERYNWLALKESIKTYGLRNSLLLAPMPTASTSQILGNNECFEPFTSNIYSRRTNAGEFVIINKYLMKELMNLGLWNEELKDNIILNKGSIQHIDFIPKHTRDKYKIVWEIPMKHVIDMAADRGAFICQSQSLNLWMEDPDYKALTSMHFYAWQAGLKTGMYYLRRKAKHQAQQFTITPSKVVSAEEPCEMCSS